MIQEQKDLIKRLSVDLGYLTQWYQNNVDANPPIWTEEHLEELSKDFYLIPKDNITDSSSCYNFIINRAVASLESVYRNLSGITSGNVSHSVASVKGQITRAIDELEKLK